MCRVGGRSCRRIFRIRGIVGRVGLVDVAFNGESSLENEQKHLLHILAAPAADGQLRHVRVDSHGHGIFGVTERFGGSVLSGSGGVRIAVSYTHLDVYKRQLLLLSALTIINAVTVAASAAKSKLPMVSAALLIGHWPQLTALASCMTAVAFTFGTVLYLAELSRPDKLPRFVTFAFSFAGWVAFAITAAVILGTAFVMAVTMHTGWAPGWFEYMPETSNLQAFATLLILSCGVLVGASMILRGYLRSSEKALRANGGLLFLFFLAFAIHVVSFAVPLLRLAGYHFHVMLPAHLHWASNPIWAVSYTHLLAYWLLLVVAVLAGVLGAPAIFGWTPNFTTSTLRFESFSLVVRMIVAYDLGLWAWLLACSAVTRASIAPNDPAAH